MSAILMVLVLQGSEVDRLVEEMADENIDVRDRAQEELLKLGRPAEARLKELREQASEEVRARIDSILKEIERRDRMKDFCSGPTLVTLDVADAELPDVVATLEKRTRTSLRIAGAEKEKVTVKFTGVPLFEAVDRICRAHGGLTWAVQSSQGAATITIQKGKYVGPPRRFAEAFAVWLESVHLLTEYDLKGGETSTGSLLFRLAWESGNQPVRAKLALKELTDEHGRSHLELVVRQDYDYGWGNVPSQFDVRLAGVPPEDAKRFARVRGTLELSFPTDMDSLKFEEPGTKVGASLSGKGIEATILAFAVADDQVRARVRVRRIGDHFRPDIQLRDKTGKAMGARRSSTTYGQQEMTYEYTYSLAKGQEPATLEVTALLGSVERSISFDFTDLPIRP